MRIGLQYYSLCFAGEWTQQVPPHGRNSAGVKQVWQCSVLLAVWRRYELRLLKLLELFSFADTLADFNAVEQRQPGQQGRVKRPNVHSSAK